MLHTAMLIFVTLGCVWLIASHQIHTGVSITLGLVFVVGGCIGMLDDAAFAMRAFELQIEGLALIVWGVGWRVVLLPAWRKHLMRWWLPRLVAKHTGVDRRQPFRPRG